MLTQAPCVKNSGTAQSRRLRDPKAFQFKRVACVRTKRAMSPARRTKQPSQEEETDPNDSRISTAEQQAYWAQQTTDDNGMLGGYPQVSRVDVQFSLTFLRKLRRTHPPSGKNADAGDPKAKYMFRRCLESGAGIGRVTVNLLAPLCETIDIIEPMEIFTAVLTAPEAPLVKSRQLRRVYNVPLQDWTAESKPSYQRDEPQQQNGTELGKEGQYDLIFNQWCLNYLSNPHLIRYFRSLIPLLAPDGWIIVKENISTAAAGADTWWEEDSSVTRSDRKFPAVL